MNRCSISLSANAGISLTISNTRIWIDLLHDRKTPYFSTVSEDMIDKLFMGFNYSSPDLICFTHCHWDHFSKKLVEKYLEINNNVKLALPEPIFDKQFLVKDKEEISAGVCKAIFHKLIHAGEGLQDTIHYGISVISEDKTIIFSGDSIVADDTVLDLANDRNVDVAVMNFNWVTLKRGRDFIVNKLKPKHLVLVHIPFKEDDINGYREAAVKGCKQIKEQGVDAYLLSEPFQTIWLDI